jgi:hypothetical protein
MVEIYCDNRAAHNNRMQHKWIRFNSMQMANLLLRCILVPRCNRAAGVSEYLEV